MSSRSRQRPVERARPATGWIRDRWALSGRRHIVRDGDEIRYPKKRCCAITATFSFGMTSWDMENGAGASGCRISPSLGNNSAMNQIRCGQIGKYGPERGCVGNKLGDVDFEKFAECFGGLGHCRARAQSRFVRHWKRPRRVAAAMRDCQYLGRPYEYAPGTRRKPVQMTSSSRRIRNRNSNISRKDAKAAKIETENSKHVWISDCEASLRSRLRTCLARVSPVFV